MVPYVVWQAVQDHARQQRMTAYEEVWARARIAAEWRTRYWRHYHDVEQRITWAEVGIALQRRWERTAPSTRLQTPRGWRSSRV